MATALSTRCAGACLLLSVLLAQCALAARRPSKLPAMGAPFSDDEDAEATWDLDEIEHVDDLKKMMLKAAEDDEDFCKSKKFRKTTLKLVREAPFVALLNDLQNNTKFEASDVVARNNMLWVVFDNIRTIAKIDARLGDFSDDTLSTLIAENDSDEEEASQFEGLAYIDTRDTWLLLRESRIHPVHGKLNPELEEVKISKGKNPHYSVTDNQGSKQNILTTVTNRQGAYNSMLNQLTPANFDNQQVRKCLVDFDLEAENKGFEGLHYFEGPDKAQYAIGLCESNFCKKNGGRDEPGLDRGNGRLVLSRFHDKDGDKPCVWKTEKVIDVPASAYFLDYSGFGFGVEEDGEADVAIVSQEDAAVWIGRWSWKEVDFVNESGKIWHLPRDNHCGKVYCNIEGVQFLDKYRLVMASDRCKGTQSFTCHAKDQALHVFALSQ